MAMLVAVPAVGCSNGEDGEKPSVTIDSMRSVRDRNHDELLLPRYDLLVRGTDVVRPSLRTGAEPPRSHTHRVAIFLLDNGEASSSGIIGTL